MGMIEEQVRWLVAEELDLGREAVLPQSRFVEDLGAASIDIVWLLIALEERFGVEFPFEQIDQLNTAAKVAAMIVSLIDSSGTTNAGEAAGSEPARQRLRTAKRA
jgi:acyl carrier protein